MSLCKEKGLHAEWCPHAKRLTLGPSHFVMISIESVEKAPEQISSLDVMKNGFVIRSTIEDLLLGYGKMTPEKGVKNIKWTFSTDSSQHWKTARLNTAQIIGDPQRVPDRQDFKFNPCRSYRKSPSSDKKNPCFHLAGSHNPLEQSWDPPP